jgi:hypothetical protein
MRNDRNSPSLDSGSLSRISDINLDRADGAVDQFSFCFEGGHSENRQTRSPRDPHPWYEGADQVRGRA